MAYIITASGKLFYPLSPTVDQVRVEDIAAHLSKMTRWTGATIGDDIYTVAQHAVTVSFLTDPGYELEGLHHDSTEAYLVDVARPVKYSHGFMDSYMKYEAVLAEVIYKALNIPYNGTMHPSVKEADDRMLATEARDLMPVPETGESAWEFKLSRAYDFQIGHIWSPRVARMTFMERHNELMAKRRAA